MAGVQWWLAIAAGKPFPWWPEVQRSALQNFDWEMMTYWAIAGLSHAVLYYRESRDRALRTAQLETKLIEAQMQHAPAAAPAAFPLQHAARDLRADAPRRRRRGPHADSPERPAPHDAREPRRAAGHAEDGARLPDEVSRDRADAFADRLTVQFDVQPEALDVLVPTLLVQPLVENAIKHGISKKKGPGHIPITARARHDKLCIEVRDDGWACRTRR